MSDFKYLDVFRDPLWLLSNLLIRHKIFIVQTNAAWSPSNLLTGFLSLYPTYIYVSTGTTASSKGEGYNTTFGLNFGDRDRRAIDYGKRLEWYFTILRLNSDSEVIARIQIKQTSNEGDLADVGLGLRIDNYTVLGEAYGSARQTVALGTLTDDRLWKAKIILIPGVRVEFWVNDVLVGTLTGTAVPTGTLNPTLLVVSIINGATGGVNAYFFASDIKIIQAW